MNGNSTSSDVITPKSVFASKTIWGAAIAAIASAFAARHMVISNGDQAALANNIPALIGLAGSILAIIGRIVASRPVAISPAAARNIFLPMALLLGGIGVAAAQHGCANPALSTTQQVIVDCTTANYSYVTALDALTDLRVAGAIDDAAWATIKTYRANVRSAIKAAAAAAQANDATGASVAEAAFNNALAQLQSALARAKATPARGATTTASTGAATP